MLSYFFIISASTWVSKQTQMVKHCSSVTFFGQLYVCVDVCEFMNFDLSDAGAGRAGKIDQQSRVSSLGPTLPYHGRVYGRCKVVALLDPYTSITTLSDTLNCSELHMIAICFHFLFALYLLLCP